MVSDVVSGRKDSSVANPVSWIAASAMTAQNKPTDKMIDAATPQPSREIRWLVWLIPLAGVLAYHNSFQGVFLLDDDASIVRNESIRQLWPPWEMLGHRDRPVLNVSLALNYAIHEARVWGYHAVNLAIHIAAALLLFGVVRRTLLVLKVGSAGSAAATAFVISLIWMVHPLQTQSVTYVIQRGTSMMGLFYLLSLYCVIRGVDSDRRRRWFFASVMACALGMGSKGDMVTAPVVIALFDWVFLAGSWRLMFGRRWSLYAGLVSTWVVLVLTGVAQDVLFPRAGATSDVGFSYTRVTPYEYALTQAEVITHYLRLVFWPDSLCLDYEWPFVRSLSDVLAPAILVVGLLGLTVYALMRRHWLGFVGAWFFIIMSPTSSFIPIRDAAFEHRMYLPLAAPIVVAVVAAMRVMCLFHGAGRQRAVRWAAGCVGLLIVGALSARTVARNRDYHSDLIMWHRVLAARPQNVRARYNLGNAYLRRELYERAIAAYQEALERNSNHVSAHYNLGHALTSVGRYEEAIRHYEAAAAVPSESTYQRWRPESLAQTRSHAHNSRGNALLRLDRLDEAALAYVRAIETHPANVQGFYNLGNVYARQGQYDQAIQAYEITLKMVPEHAGAHGNLGNVYFSTGRVDDAIAEFRQAIRLQPGTAILHYNLGSALQVKGETSAALEQFREAVRLNPDDLTMRETLETAQRSTQPGHP